MRIKLFGAMIMACSIVSAGACGGSSPTQPSSGDSQSDAAPNPVTTELTATEINHIRAAVNPALSLALSKIGTALSTLGVKNGVRSVITPIQPMSTTPISASTACPESGTATVSGTVDDNTNSSGSGSANVNFQIGFSNCRSAGIVIQGRPSLSFDVQFKFSQFNIVNPAHVRVGGAITFVLDNVAGSASFNCAGTVDLDTYAVNESGNVTLQYPEGQHTTAVACSAF
jgi:hypothetical protein